MSKHNQHDTRVNQDLDATKFTVKKHVEGNMCRMLKLKVCIGPKNLRSRKRI